MAVHGTRTNFLTALRGEVIWSNGRYADSPCGACKRPPRDHTIKGPVSHPFKLGNASE